MQESNLPPDPGAAEAEADAAPLAGEASRRPSIARLLMVTATVVVAATVIVFGLQGRGSDGGVAGATLPPPVTVASSPTTSVPAAWQTQFLDCVAHRESRNTPTAIGPGGLAFGTYQILPGTWNETVAHFGWTDLAGVRPDQARPADQDRVAMGLLQWQGATPWGGGCTG